MNRHNLETVGRICETLNSGGLAQNRRVESGQSREDYSTASCEGAVWPEQEHALQPHGGGGVPLLCNAGAAFRGLGRV